MISSQHGTEFSEENYGELKKVYSIWICTNPPKKLNNTIIRYSMKEEIIAGKINKNVAYEENEFDLISIVFVCLDKNGGGNNKALELLNLLLVEDVGALNKCKKLESDFNIPMTTKLSKEVDFMCNLSYGVLQRGYDRGISQGISQGIEQGNTNSLRNLMHNMNFTLDKSMAVLGIPQEEKAKYEALLAQ